MKRPEKIVGTLIFATGSRIPYMFSLPLEPEIVINIGRWGSRFRRIGRSQHEVVY